MQATEIWGLFIIKLMLPSLLLYQKSIIIPNLPMRKLKVIGVKSVVLNSSDFDSQGSRARDKNDRDRDSYSVSLGKPE